MTVPCVKDALYRNLFIESGIDTHTRVRAVGPPQRDLLIRMYDRFDPLGAAFGLPPYGAEARRAWIGDALHQKMNVAALSAAGEIVGHCFLAADKPYSAELAVFVHQEFRRRRVGTALIKAALARACAEGLRRVWCVTPSENSVALHLLRNCGFRLMKSISLEPELEIYLP